MPWPNEIAPKFRRLLGLCSYFSPWGQHLISWGREGDDCTDWTLGRNLGMNAHRAPSSSASSPRNRNVRSAPHRPERTNVSRRARSIRSITGSPAVSPASCCKRHEDAKNKTTADKTTKITKPAREREGRKTRERSKAESGADSQPGNDENVLNEPKR